MRGYYFAFCVQLKWGKFQLTPRLQLKVMRKAIPLHYVQTAFRYVLPCPHLSGALDLCLFIAKKHVYSMDEDSFESSSWRVWFPQKICVEYTAWILKYTYCRVWKERASTTETCYRPTTTQSINLSIFLFDDATEFPNLPLYLIKIIVSLYSYLCIKLIISK